MKFKNFFLSAMCVAATFNVVANAESGLNASEALNTGVITVKGTTNAKGTVIAYKIMPEDANVDTLSDEEATKAQYLFGTVKTNADGSFEFDVELSDLAGGGRYIVYAASEDEEISTDVSHINRTELKELSEDLNKSASKGATLEILEESYKKAGLSESECNTYKERLSENLYGKKYDADTLLTDIRSLLAIYKICDGESSDAIIEGSQDILSINYAEDFKELSSDIKTEFVKMVSQRIKISKDYKDLITGSLIDASIKKAANYSQLQNVCEKYNKEIGIDLSDYNDLSEYYKGECFKNLFEKKPQDAKEVKDDFEDCIPKEDKKPSGGGGGGGSSSGSSGGIFAGGSTIVEPEPESAFNDISSHWAKEYVERLYEKSVISGYSDGGFHPDNTVTRAEFAQLLKKAFNITSSDKKEFSDVNSSDWYYSAVTECAGAGIIYGSDGMFRPNEKITREDAAVMLSRIISEGEEAVASFGDYDKISDYAKAAVASLSDKGIISGDESGCFNPKDNTTRAQAAVMICRALEKK